MTRFRDLRLQRGLSQTEFRHLYNEKYGRSYTAAAISQIEHGRRMPELGALLDFADFYGVSLDYLLKRDGILCKNQMSKQLKNFIEQLSARIDREKNSNGDNGEDFQENRENVEILRGLLKQSVLLAQRVEREARNS